MLGKINGLFERSKLGDIIDRKNTGTMKRKTSERKDNPGFLKLAINQQFFTGDLVVS
jgi:hypothetical protein